MIRDTEREQTNTNVNSRRNSLGGAGRDGVGGGTGAGARASRSARAPVSSAHLGPGRRRGLVRIVRARRVSALACSRVRARGREAARADAAGAGGALSTRLARSGVERAPRESAALSRRGTPGAGETPASAHPGPRGARPAPARGAAAGHRGQPRDEVRCINSGGAGVRDSDKNDVVGCALRSGLVLGSEGVEAGPARAGIGRVLARLTE